MADDGPGQHRERDSASLIVIGGFFLLFAVLVLLGSFWEEPGPALVVNLVASALLFLIGSGMAFAGWRLRSPASQTSDGTEP